MWWNRCKILILFVLLRCVSPDSLKRPEDGMCRIWFCWPYSFHTAIYFYLWLYPNVPLWERQGSLAFWSSEPSSFLGHFPSNAAALFCLPYSRPTSSPASLAASLSLFSLSPIRQPHQNCKLGNLWGSTSHYEQLIKFHTKTQKTPKTLSWGNPTEQTKDKLCQTALWKIENRAAIEAQFPGIFLHWPIPLTPSLWL